MNNGGKISLSGAARAIACSCGRRLPGHLWLEMQLFDGMERTHRPAMAGAVRGGLATVCPLDAEGAAG